MIKKGKPEDVILQTVEEEGIDQIIMGKSGKHGLERFLMGSTTERVIRKAAQHIDGSGFDVISLWRIAK